MQNSLRKFLSLRIQPAVQPDETSEARRSLFSTWLLPLKVIIAPPKQLAKELLKETPEFHSQLSDGLTRLSDPQGVRNFQEMQQGQAIAVHRVREIIARLKVKAGAHELDRGLSLSLPYFDDRKMGLSLYDFEVIPAGRIPFDPRYAGMVARAEMKKVAKDTRFSPATRRHLLAELRMLEETFQVDGRPSSPGSTKG